MNAFRNKEMIEQFSKQIKRRCAYCGKLRSIKEMRCVTEGRMRSESNWACNEDCQKDENDSKEIKLTNLPNDQ